MAIRTLLIFHLWCMSLLGCRCLRLLHVPSENNDLDLDSSNHSDLYLTHLPHFPMDEAELISSSTWEETRSFAKEEYSHGENGLKDFLCRCVSRLGFNDCHAIEEAGAGLPAPKSLAENLGTFHLALTAHVTGCYFLLNYAEHVIAHPHLAHHVRRPFFGSGGPGRDLEPALAATRLLLDGFSVLQNAIPQYAPPEFLYRVEDLDEGWALSFQEAEQICDTTDHITRFDADVCQDRLLTANRTLTLTVPISFADGPGIYEWGERVKKSKHEGFKNFIRWDLKPPKSFSKIQRSLPGRTSIMQHKAGPPTWLNTSEIILLPGTRLKILSLSYDQKYRVVHAEQLADTA